MNPMWTASPEWNRGLLAKRSALRRVHTREIRPSRSTIDIIAARAGGLARLQHQPDQPAVVGSWSDEDFCITLPSDMRRAAHRPGPWAKVDESLSI